MDSFGHLGDTIQNDNKKLLVTPEVISDMIRVRVKVEITSMSRYDRKDQSVGCFDSFNKTFLMDKELEDTAPQSFLIYAPFPKMRPMQFIDTNIIAGKLLEKEKTVHFLSFEKDNKIKLQTTALPANEIIYQNGQSVAISESSLFDSEAKLLEVINPDVIVPPCWIVSKSNHRLGGGKFRWTNLIKSFKNKKSNKTVNLKVFAFIFDVQAMEEEFPESEKLLILDDVFTANEIYYPPNEENKNEQGRDTWANPLSGPIPGLTGPKSSTGQPFLPPRGPMLPGGEEAGSLEEMERMIQMMGPRDLRQCPTQNPSGETGEGFSQNSFGE